MKYKKVLLVLFFIVLMFCLIPFNLQSTTNFQSDNSDLKNSVITTNTVDYILNDNILLYNTTNINLRHNNIITNDYNGTYSFNETIGSFPTGWNNLSVGNGNVEISEYFNVHNTILNLTTIDTDDAKIEQIFDDGNQISDSIELWFLTTDATHTSYILLFDNDLQAITLRIVSDTFSIHNGIDWITFDTIPYDNEWYHIKIDFDCITDNATFYINNYNESSHNFGNDGNNINKIQFINSGVGATVYSDYFDAVGYPFSSNYTLNENIYPNIEFVDSNILSLDMYQFNFDSNGHPYTHMESDIYGWNIIEPSSTFIDFPTFHYYRRDTSESIKSKNIVKIISHITGAGIKNESLNLYFDKINITFGLEFLLFNLIIPHSFNITIKSKYDIEIIKIAFIPISETEVEMVYFNNTSWVLLETFVNLTPFDTYDFNLYLNNFQVNLLQYKNGVFSNSHSFPYIINRNGMNSLSFLAYGFSDDSDYLIMKIQNVGIYQYNISQTLEYGCMRYDFYDIWSFNKYNLFNYTSNDFTKIITYIYQTEYVGFSIRNQFGQSIFYNIYGKEIKDYTNLWIITNNTININNILTIEGVKLLEYYNDIYITEYTAGYYFYNTNRNYSYFYVDTINRLHYSLLLQTNDSIEQILIVFDINNRNTDNASFFMKGRETKTCYGTSDFRIYYTGLAFHTIISLLRVDTTYMSGIPFARIFSLFYFVVDDFQSNNSFTDYTSEGYIYDISIVYNFIYRPITEITILTLSLMEIIIPIIMILAPTFMIYGITRKKEMILPLLLLFSIICFISELIPLELFFIISTCLILGIFLQYKRKEVI